MAGNNKVIYGDQTIMDISDSTVNSNNLLSGEIGYSGAGDRVVGSVVIPTDFVPASTGGTFEGDVTIDTADGTTSTIGQSKLILGNSTGTGTDENSKGVVRLYSRGSKYVDICAPDGSAINDNYELNVPNKSGTIAVTSDIPAAQVNSDWNASSGVAEILNKPALATVATSGSYSDLSNKPSYLWASMGSTVASLNDLVNLMNNSGNQRSYEGTIKITADIGVGVTGWNRIYATAQNAPNNGSYDLGMFCMFFPENTTTNIKYALINGKTTGNYSVAATGSIPYSSDITTAIQALDVTGASNIAASKTISGWSETDGKVSISTQNISITKSQVSDFPTIPTVNNATLTIQKNGTTVKTFTANASSNVTCNITVPTNTNELTNGAGYITSSGSCSSATTAVSCKDANLTYCYLSSGTAILQGNSSGAVWLQIKSNNWKTVFQNDGNLVVYQGNTAKWSSGTSSRRFKHNIQDMTEERARKILDIRPVTFDWNEDQPITTRQYDNAGVIAEEVANVCPDLVVFEGEDHTIARRVEYERFTPYLIKMVQTQQQEIDLLKQEVEILKQEVRLLKGE